MVTLGKYNSADFNCYEDNMSRFEIQDSAKLIDKGATSKKGVCYMFSYGYQPGPDGQYNEPKIHTVTGDGTTPIGNLVIREVLGSDVDLINIPIDLASCSVFETDHRCDTNLKPIPFLKTNGIKLEA